MRCEIIFVFVLCCLSGISLCDQKFEFNGLRLELSNSDAEFKYKNDVDDDHVKFEIKMRVKEFNEIDSTGALVVKGTIPSTGSWSTPQLTTLNGVSVNKTTFTGSVQISGKSPATFTIDTYIVKGGGNVMNGAQSLAVSPNDIKFTLSISNWPWTSATNTLNAILKFENSGGHEDDDENEVKEKNSDEKEMHFGGAALELATQVVVDGKNVALLPIITAPATRSNEVTLRFPHFNSTVAYDPTISAYATSAGFSTLNLNHIIPLFSVGCSLFLFFF